MTNDKGSLFFILEEGSSAAFIPDPEDASERQVKLYNEPGQFFGEVSLLRKQPRAQLPSGLVDME